MTVSPGSSDALETVPDGKNAGHGGASVRFSRVLTILYTVSMVGFAIGTVMWAFKPHTPPGTDAPLDVSDTILIVSWAVLVVAAVLTARRSWQAPHA